MLEARAECDDGGIFKWGADRKGAVILGRDQLLVSGPVVPPERSII